MSSLLALRIALRRLRASSGHALFAVISIALGLGTLVGFSSHASALLRTSPFPEPSRLILVQGHELDGLRPSWRFSVTRGDYEDLRRLQKTMSSTFAWTRFGTTYDDGTYQGDIEGEAVSGEAFSTLGMDAFLGRVLTPIDDQPEAPPVIVVSYGFWNYQLAGDPNVLGRTARIGGWPFVVVGVANPALRSIGPASLSGAVGWIPLSSTRHFTQGDNAVTRRSERARAGLSVMGRLRPEHSVDTANTELGVISSGLDGAFPRASTRSSGLPTGRNWHAVPIAEAFAPPGGGSAIWLLMVLVSLVWLAACVNIANLMLARESGRRRDVDTCLALGASRWQLAREQILGASIVAVSGASGAIATAHVLLVWTSERAAHFGVYLPTGLTSESYLALSLGLAVTVVIIGVWPALTTANRPRGSDRAALLSGGRNLWRGRRGWLLAQITVATAFLLVAIGCVFTLRQRAGYSSGLDLGRFAVAGVEFSGKVQRGPSSPGLKSVLERLDSVPSIEAAAAGTGFPFGVTGPLAVAQSAATSDRLYQLSVTPGFFRAVGIEILQGAGLTEADWLNSASVVVLSETASRVLFPDGSPLQQQLNLDGRSLRVVGVAEDTDTGIEGRRLARGVAYLVLPTAPSGRLYLLARAAEPQKAIPELRTSLREEALEARVGNVVTARTLLSPRLETLRTTAAAAGLLGTLVLALSAIGLYGILSAILAQRTKELAVRRALGATPRQVILAILGEMRSPLLLGLVLGVLLGTLGRGLIGGVLSQSDWTSEIAAVGTAATTLCVTAILCVVPPTLRAATVELSRVSRHLRD